MSTHYAAGSMPLVFTQEDFLVIMMGYPPAGIGYNRRSTRYVAGANVSCVHAGGLSCYYDTLLETPCANTFLSPVRLAKYLIGHHFFLFFDSAL